MTVFICMLTLLLAVGDEDVTSLPEPLEPLLIKKEMDA